MVPEHNDDLINHTVESALVSSLIVVTVLSVQK